MCGTKGREYEKVHTNAHKHTTNTTQYTSPVLYKCLHGVKPSHTHTHLHSEVKQHRLLVKENFVGGRGFILITQAGLSSFIECGSDERPIYVLLVNWLADWEQLTGYPAARTVQ